MSRSSPQLLMTVVYQSQSSSWPKRMFDWIVPGVSQGSWGTYRTSLAVCNSPLDTSSSWRIARQAKQAVLLKQQLSERQVSASARRTSASSFDGSFGRSPGIGQSPGLQPGRSTLTFSPRRESIPEEPESDGCDDGAVVVPPLPRRGRGSWQAKQAGLLKQLQSENEGLKTQQQLSESEVLQNLLAEKEEENARLKLLLAEKALGSAGFGTPNSYPSSPDRRTSAAPAIESALL